MSAVARHLVSGAMSAMDRGYGKTRRTSNSRSYRTPPAMPIVDPGPIWKVDSARDYAKSEFSHSLDPLLPVAVFSANDRSTLKLDLRSRRRESQRRRQRSFAGGHHQPARDPS